MYSDINTDLGLRHYAYPSIEQFRNVIYNVNHKSRYVGQSPDGEPMYDESRVKPTLRFMGTTKLHGTNFSVVIDRKNEKVYYQSRENIIAPIKDNAGSSSYIASFQNEFADYVTAKNYDAKYDIVIIYGEWCGGNIQRGVALNGLDKMFVVFDIRLRNSEDDKDYVWLGRDEVAAFEIPDKRVYNIYRFETWEIDIDFNYPQLKQNDLIAVTEKVEANCPVGKAFGVDGAGEGVVWKCITEGYTDSGFWMKVKGEKHSASKVKKLAEVDVEKVNSIKEFVEMAVTENRCRQGIDKLIEADLPVSRKSLGDYLRWIHNDVVKEELDTILKNGLEVKDVAGSISAKAREWFFQHETEYI